MTATFKFQSDVNASRASKQYLETRVAELETELKRKDVEHRYAQLVRTIWDLVHICVPKESIVLVISKGDDDLLEWRARRGWHYPQTDNGTYAGHHPASSTEAISHLEELRRRGAEFLLIPRDAFWWLEYYSEFTQHLQNNYGIATYQEDVCLIYRLMKSI